jgi:Na+/proline symporter
MLPLFVLLYLVLTLLLGLAATRLVANVGDFFSASRRLPMMLSAFALFALWFGSETIFGASAAFVEDGLLGVIEDPFGGALCLVLFGLFLVRPLYRRNLLTLGDVFREAYGHRTEYLASFFMILTFVGYIAAQLIALAMLFESVFDLAPAYGRILSAVIVTAYVAGGGMWSVSLTDFVQSVVIMVALVLVVALLWQQIDPELLWQAPTPRFFDFTPNERNGMSWLDYAAAWATLGLGSLASQDIFQRANAARSERVAVLSTLWGAALYLLFALLPLLLALMALQLYPDLLQSGDENLLLRLVQDHAPLWLQALFFGALLSAVFSTCSGALLAPASILAENLIRPLFLQHEDEAALLRVSRWCVVFMACCATLVAFSGQGIYELVGQSSALGAVSILLPLLAALFMEQPSALSAQLGMTAGLMVYALCDYDVIDLGLPSMFAGMLASFVGMVLGWKWKAVPAVPATE